MPALALPDGATLALHRWRGTPGGAPVLMVHGAVENARVFYSASGRGLAPYLAASGLNAYALDLRGRGDSRPPIHGASAHGQWESIAEDIPAASDHLHTQHDGAAQHWVAHSWGGVLMVAALARRAHLRGRVASLVFFGTKRSIAVRSLRRVVVIDVLWLGLAPLVTRALGYLPARAMGLGSDNESRRSHAEAAAWIRPGPWIDPRDGFDYGAALRGVGLPPLLAFAGPADRVLGHPRDVRAFLGECGIGPGELRLLARANGHRRDYGHVDMLTAPEAPQEHFPAVIEWIEHHAHPGRTSA